VATPPDQAQDRSVTTKADEPAHGQDQAERRGEGQGQALRSLLSAPPGTYGTSDTPGAPGGKSRTRAATAAMAGPLAGLQERLYAQGTAGGDPRRLLLVLQGMDTSGKGGTVKHVISGLNPAGCQVMAFRAPTEEERRHHFLWRVRRALPRAGEIGIFDRSHYEDVLAARVRGLVPRDVWSGRYDEINDFERSLAHEGVTLVKVFLDIGYEEQRERLLARLDNPDKRWKFSPSDIDDRALWPAYQAAYAEALARCSTPAAPWHVVPADRRWYRDWAVTRLLREHLEEIGPRYPAADYDMEECRKRLRAT
jgi:PPK2 family polyphosphate:nucleotide phosphotransferase